eukprot:TRINITY_DN2025_c0_g2_i2.p1 TRINITY_DN2025_c0_g2~~TRINITY_DN2025_c0_g2_i2.p1  ORF type:complete len:311 (+),score=120.49 TRINITY_DN2025_c0_g2_i2:82-1014(+)
MGGGYYDRDVGSTYYDAAPGAAAVVAAPVAESFTKEAEEIFNRRKEMDPIVNPLGRQLVCSSENAIVCAIDVTGSMGDWSKIIYDKLPMFYGQILMQGYLEDPSISFAAVGDCNFDRAPLQVTEFAQGLDIDEQIEKMWLEGGGGAGDAESYEFAAYFYSTHVEFPNMAPGHKPFFFFTGDEKFYRSISRTAIKKYLGDDLPASVMATTAFDQLKEKYHVFLLKKPYSDDRAEQKISEMWETVLPAHHILRFSNPKACIDVMLGALALAGRTRTLDQYVNDLQDRGQSQQRIDEVTAALEHLEREIALIR